jgi:glycosyltransferase involved in cell wall biosynthesis
MGKTADVTKNTDYHRLGKRHVVALARFHHGGGPEALVRGLVEFLGPHGHSFSILTMRRAEEEDFRLWSSRLEGSLGSRVSLDLPSELEERSARLVAMACRALSAPFHAVFYGISKGRDRNYLLGERIEEWLLGRSLRRRLEAVAADPDLADILAYHVSVLPPVARTVGRIRRKRASRGHQAGPRLYYFEITLPRARRSPAGVRRAAKACDRILAPCREAAEELRRELGPDFSVEVLPWMITWGDQYYRAASARQQARGSEAFVEAASAAGRPDSAAGEAGSMLEQRLPTRSDDPQRPEVLVDAFASRCVFGSIGRMSREKRMELVVEAFEKAAEALLMNAAEVARADERGEAHKDRPHRLQEIGLLLVGSGPLYESVRDRLRGALERLEEQRARLALDTKQAPPQIWAKLLSSCDDLATDFFGGIDVYVSASTAEGFSVAMIEAMASAKPVVATAVGGAKDWIDDSVGRLLAPEDAGGFANAMFELAVNPTLRASMGAASRARFERGLHPKVLGARYKELFEGNEESAAKSAGSGTGDGPDGPELA